MKRCLNTTTASAVWLAGSLVACDATTDVEPPAVSEPTAQVEGELPTAASIAKLFLSKEMLGKHDFAAPHINATWKPSCEAPEIDVVQGNLVIPQTKLDLIGAVTGADSDVAEWSWVVQQPNGSTAQFVPNSKVQHPTLTANVAGTYTFTLHAKGANGQSYCPSKLYFVEVTPEDALHVELLWDTPEDPDQTDVGPAKGTDLDLHVAHKYASGRADLDGDGAPDPWFDWPFDAYWFNPYPRWDNANSAADDDPSLDRDDTDGAGPENLNIGTPASNSVYRVGVHYWNAHDFGGSTATIRIYLYGTLAYEKSLWLEELDMWDVGFVHFDSALPYVEEIVSQDGQPKVTPNYTNPYFQ